MIEGMKPILLLGIALVFFTIGFMAAKNQAVVVKQTTITISPSPTPTPTIILSQSYSNPLPTAGNGPRNDIVEIQPITANKSVAQVGDDVSFTVTIQNQAPYSKNIQAICFNSTEGNFGCQNGKNLGPQETFNINNSGRFYSGGAQSVWITWTQDNVNYYRPLNATAATITIQN